MANQQPVDLTNLVTQLTTLITLMGNNTQAINQNQNTTSFSKPEPFKGKSSADARRFLAHFDSWAAERNDLTGANNVNKRIKAALQLCSEDAGQWASTHLDSITRGTNPFADWDAFLEAFKQRWLAADEEAEAIGQLRRLKQGPKQSMAEHAAKFREIAGRTQITGQGLRQMFLESITKKARESFSYGESLIKDPVNKATTFDKIITRCIAQDYALNDPSMDLGRGQHSSSSTSAPDPNAMDVDASRTGPTVQDWRSRMRGKCFGCGRTGHSAGTDECRGKNIVCRYCSRTGHYETVCLDKFVGRERGRGNRQRTRRDGRGGGGARVAANSNGNFTLFPNETNIQGPDPGPAQNTAPAPAPAQINANNGTNEALLAINANLQALLNRMGPQPEGHDQDFA
jgi:hypothetical protein